MVEKLNNLDRESMFWIGSILGYIFFWILNSFYKSGNAPIGGFIFLIVLAILDLFVFDKLKRKGETYPA